MLSCRLRSPERVQLCLLFCIIPREGVIVYVCDGYFFLSIIKMLSSDESVGIYFVQSGGGGCMTCLFSLIVLDIRDIF